MDMFKSSADWFIMVDTIPAYAPQPSVEYQNEQIRQQRQARYEVESDPIRLDYDEALARGEDTAEQLRIDWLASKDRIREELPYIEANAS